MWFVSSKENLDEPGKRPMTKLTLGPGRLLTTMAQIIWIQKEERDNGQKAGWTHWGQTNLTLGDTSK